VGLSPKELAELLAIVLPAVDRHRAAARAARPHRQRAPGAGRKRRLHPAKEVLLVLIYLHHNVAHRVVGQMFGVSADISEALFHEIVPILQDVCPANRFEAKKRWKRHVPPWQPEELDRVLIDTFATSVLQPTRGARQKWGYTGKKKRPTRKTQVATDATARCSLARRATGGQLPTHGSLKAAPPYAHGMGECRTIDEFLISRITPAVYATA
jgi:hypothetical protein